MNAEGEQAVVTIRMPSELRERLEAEAKREERTVSQLVRLILSRRLDEMAAKTECTCGREP